MPITQTRERTSTAVPGSRPPPLPARGSPWRLLWRVLWPAINHFISDQGFIYAGYIAFASLFAMFPFLLFMVSLAGYLGQSDAAAASIDLALEFLPIEVAGVLRPVILEVRTHASTSLLTLSIMLSLWFASSGFELLRVAVNLAYDVKQYPHFVWSRLQSMLLTIVSAIVIIVAMLTLIVGPVISQLVELLSRGQYVEPNLYALIRQGIGIVLLFGLFSGLYTILPNVGVRMIDVLPGAFVAVMLWVLSAKVYSLYLQNIGRYTVTYGSLAGIILTMFFLYISAIVFIFGAQLNGAVRRERKRLAGKGAAPLVRPTEPPVN